MKAIKAIKVVKKKSKNKTYTHHSPILTKIFNYNIITT